MSKHKSPTKTTIFGFLKIIGLAALLLALLFLVFFLDKMRFVLHCGG